MEGIVSLLDTRHTEKVFKIWELLKTQCGIVGTQVPKFPHFSYHVAQSYSAEKITPLLKSLTANCKKFQVRTTGLGIFAGGTPVVYVPVVRDPALTQFHQAISPQLSTATTTAIHYYEPTQWLPHITLAHGDLTPKNLPEVVRVLNEQDLTWEIVIDNLTWLSEEKIKVRVDFVW